MADALVLTSSAQVKVTLPRQLVSLVKKKAGTLGLSVSGYVRHLLIEDVRPLSEYLENADLPTFPLTKKQERIGKKALREHRQGKSIEMKF